MTGPSRLADALQRARDADASQFVTQAAVTATPGGGMVTVDLDGPQTWPHIGSYSPVVGHVVVLAGGPGWWVCLGSPSGAAAGGGGGAPAAHSHAEADVSGLTADLAALTDAVAGKVANTDGRLSDVRAWSLYDPATVPSAGQVPTWSAGSGRYVPGTPAAGGGGGTVDSTVRTALFGAASRTSAPVCEAQLVTAYTNLAAGDYVMLGNMALVGPDPDAMFSGTAEGYRVTAPVGGRYDVEWAWSATAAAGATIAAKVVKNYPGGTPAQKLNSAVLSDARTTPGEGTSRIRSTVALATGDYLGFMLYSSVQFSMPVTTFGGIRTRLVVRYIGPN